jgi:hypothetical protein
LADTTPVFSSTSAEVESKFVFEVWIFVTMMISSGSLGGGHLDDGLIDQKCSGR